MPPGERIRPETCEKIEPLNFGLSGMFGVAFFEAVNQSTMYK